MLSGGIGDDVDKRIRKYMRAAINHCIMGDGKLG